MKDSHLVLKEGRKLAYTELGRAAGACVLFFHGAPMSRLHLVPLEPPFAACGLRVISPDRPGYGRSSPQAGRSMLDWPNDIAALADALGIDHFLVAGHSSGGAYAIACAAALGERVVGAITIGGVTDMGWPGAWKGYLEGRIEVQLMKMSDERASVARCAEHFGADGSGFFSEGFDLPAPDPAMLGDETAEKALTATVVEAFRQGVGGYGQDVYLEGRGWPFDARRIGVPVEVVHGELDTLVPLAHSHHTAEMIPNATFRMLPGHGHLTTVSELPSIATSLLR